MLYARYLFVLLFLSYGAYVMGKKLLYSHASSLGFYTILGILNLVDPLVSVI